MIIKPAIGNDNINLEHPHTDGLVACYNMNDNGNVCSDMLRNKHDIPLIGTSWETNGLQANANNEYGLLDNTGNNVINSNVGTIVMRFKSLSIFDDGAERFLIDNESLGFRRFTLYKAAGNKLIFSVRDNVATHRVRLIAAQVPTWKTDVQIALIWRNDKVIWDAKGMVFNINGVHIVPFDSALAESWNTFTLIDTIVAMNSTNFARSANGTMEYLRIYNKILSEETLKDIYENPYAMFYKPNMLCNLFGAFSSGILTKQNQIFGSNAFPIGQGV